MPKLLVYSRSRNVYAFIPFNYTDTSAMLLLHSSTATGMSTVATSKTGTRFKMVVGGDTLLVTSMALLRPKNPPMSNFRWHSSGYWDNTIDAVVEYSTTASYIGEDVGQFAWYYPGTGYNQDAINSVIQQANSERNMSTLDFVVSPNNRIAFIGVGVSYSSSNLYNPGRILYKKDGTAEASDYFRYTINYGSASVQGPALRTIVQTGLGPLSSYASYVGISQPQEVSADEFLAGSDIIIDEDPESIYTPGGTSSDPHNPYPGGSSGSNPGTNDPLNSGVDTTSTSTPGTWELPFDEVPDTPAIVHSVDLGLYNVYALSAAQVKELANYLFSGVTEIGENLVKLIWGSKRDVIISLYEFPLMVTTQGTDTIRFIFDTDLAGLFHGKQLTSEYIPIDFGTIKVDRYSGTFYDFEPYTTLTLYIPYIGYIDLKPTEVVGSTLSIRGYVHLTTGELNVNVRSSRTGILGSYSGTIGRMLPIADADATEIYSSIIKTAASLGAVALAGAGMATASRAAAGISAPNKQTVDSARDTYMQSVGAWGAATRGVRGLEASMLQAQGSYEKAQADFAEQSGKYNAAQSAVRANREDFHDSASDAISNSLDAVTTGFGVSRGTVMTSSNGRVSPQRCFLRIEVPHQNVSRQQKILGYPANTSDALNSDRLHGYTELRTIELSIPNATLTEIQELEDILRGGFYLP